MNCLEKRLASHKSNMQHISYLNSFMDEMDQEVMSLTDRAFKSLCIGEEAVYNDSGFSPSPVDWHKLLAEVIPKNTQDKSSMDVKKHTAQLLSGLNNTPWQTNKNSPKVSSLLDKTKMANGDSWEKSALSIQRQLSQFSSDHQNHLVDKHFSEVKDNLKSSEKRTVSTSSKKTPTQPGKSTKNKNSKFRKVRNLNSNNFFLHSESSPFQRWGALNRLGFVDIKILPNKRPDDLYDSPPSTKLTTSDILHFSQSNKEETALESQNKPKANVLNQSAQALKVVSLASETHTELNSKQSETCPPQPEVLHTSLVQRCQSEGELCAPWRKNRIRVKGVMQTLVSSPVCEMSGTGVVDAVQIKSEVGTMEEGTSSSSTPFSISQLLSPTIPSRQGTGFPGILQAALSPAGIDQPILLETEMHSSPEIRRESYKSMVSSLLFNLKDNRKRIKAMNSPPKPKGVDCADLHKPFPLTKQDVTKMTLDISKMSDAETISHAHQQVHRSHVSPETADVQSSPVSVHINISLPDDFLALSLLEDKNRDSPVKHSKAKKNPVAIATYPSLKLYRKTSPVEFATKTNLGADPGSHSTVYKGTKHENNDKELQRENNLVKTVSNNTKLEDTHMNYAKTNRKTDEILNDNTDAAVPAEKYPPTELLEHNARPDMLERSGSSSEDNLKTGEKRKVEKRQVKDKGCHGKESNHKHLFSAKQNNYIKSQRYANVDDDECGRETVVYSGKDVPRKRKPDIGETMQNLVETFISEHVTHEAFTIKNVTCSKNDMVTACHEQKVAKNNSLSMKGNTLAKISLFTLKEQELTRTLPISKKDNIVIDNYKPATVTLEKDIAEREQREELLSTDRDVRSCKSQHCGQDFAMEGDNKQVSMLASNQKDTPGSVLEESKGQKVISDFTPPSQNFQTMPDTDTKHGEHHVTEVKLAEPKQEGAAEHSKHATGKITYTEMDGSDRNSQQSYTDSVKATSKLIEIEEQAKKISFAKESLVSIVPNNADKQLTGQSQDKSAIQKKCHCYNPEFSLIKVRENSESEGIACNERKSKENLTVNEDIVNDIKLISKDVHKVKANLLKHRTVVREDVTVLERNFNKEQVGSILDVQGCLFHVDGQTDYQEKEQVKQKETVPNLKVSAPKVETKSINESTRVPSNKELPDNNSNLVTRDELEIKNLAAESFNIPDNQTVHNDITELVEDKNDKTTKESASDDSRRPNKQQQKSKCLSKSSVIKGFFEKSNTGKIKCRNDKEITKQTSPTLEELTNKRALMNSTTYNIFNSDNTSSLADVNQLEQDNTISDLSKQSCFSHKTEESFTQIKCDLSSQGRPFKGNMEKTTDNYAFINPEIKPYISDMTVSPTSNVDKGGLVQRLRNSASSLTPTYQSNPSSPTMGKPALFKVKDNTFSVSPVTKTVRPILHKTIPEAAQPWSPGGLSGSERCDKDPDICLASVELKSPIHHTKQSSGQTISSSTPQFTTDREKKVMNDNYTMSVEEEWQLAVSSFSEEIQSCRIISGDTVKELVSSMAFTESTEGSKAPSETTESVCSENENQSHGKPAVPPKTEKALRRAMKLTTKRIQKVEAKGKSEHGRSSEKDTSQIRERRHYSSDKLPGNSSHYKEQSTDRGSNQITGENRTENRTSLSKNHTSVRQPGHQESHNKEKVTNRKSKQRDQSNLTNNHHDGNNCVSHKQSKDIGQFDGQNENIYCKRLGHTDEKYLTEKMYRRAHNLDRVLNGKHDHLPSTECLMNSDATSKLPSAQCAYLQQNSSEYTNANTTNKTVPKSFPITQRKFLQDPDSGQYFMVDMPMQVKTKTFFDPETGNYVQLPVQSFEASAPQTQSMEVVNLPPVVLYHGFVPMPVSSIPQQTSTVNVDSVVPSGYQHVFESSEMETHLPKAQKRQTALH